MADSFEIVCQDLEILRGESDFEQKSRTIGVGMMETLPNISVIMPTYNRAPLIGAAIKSILNQTYENFELLIVDDGSSDNTKQVIDNFNSPKIKYYFKAHSNIPDTRNYALNIARGEYIVWVDSDDLLEPQALALLLKAFGDDPTLDIVYTDHCLVDEQGEVKHRFDYSGTPSNNSLIAKAVYWTPILQCGTMVRKRVYDEIGGYDPAFEKSEDHEFWLKTLKRYKFKQLGTSLYKRRIHPGNISNLEDKGKYKAEVLRRMLKMFTLDEMFPNIKNRSQELLELSRIFLDREAYFDSFYYLSKSFVNKPSLGAIKLLVRIGWRMLYKLISYGVRKNR